MTQILFIRFLTSSIYLMLFKRISYKKCPYFLQCWEDYFSSIQPSQLVDSSNLFHLPTIFPNTTVANLMQNLLFYIIWSSTYPPRVQPLWIAQNSCLCHFKYLPPATDYFSHYQFCCQITIFITSEVLKTFTLLFKKPSYRLHWAIPFYEIDIEHYLQIIT